MSQAGAFEANEEANAEEDGDVGKAEDVAEGDTDTVPVYWVRSGVLGL